MLKKIVEVMQLLNQDKDLVAVIAAVVVDMVGDRRLTLKRESFSERGAPWLNGLIKTLGRARFPDRFVDERIGPVFDDHVPLQRGGVPAALLIDLDYGPWHTHDDTPERCSAGSLELVTRHLAELLLALSGAPDAAANREAET